MSDQYITSEDHLPADTSGELTLQVMDQETKHIFTTRARIARDPDELTDPDQLTILRGPHENREEQWYIEIIETDVGEASVDETVLKECFEESQEGSDVLTARGLAVTLLKRSVPLPSGYPTEITRLVEAELERYGVAVRTGDRVLGFEGDGRVRAVRTSGGSLEADVVLVVDAIDTDSVNDLITRARKLDEVNDTKTRLILDERLG